VETATIFAANAKAVLRERPVGETRARRFGWLLWRPSPALAFSAALNLVLVAAVGYGVLRQRPSTPRLAADQPEVVETASLHGATRGAEQVVRTQGHAVVLTVDLPEHYEHYLYSVSRAGTKELSGELSAPAGAESLSVRIPGASLASGEYQVTLTGETGAREEILGSCDLVVTPK
jgi:hypothetical protein